MGWQCANLSWGCLTHRQGPWHNLILSIIYLEATLSGREILPNTDSFDIKERVVNKAIGPLAVGRRQVNYLFSFQGTLKLSVLLGDLIAQSCDGLILNFLKQDLLLKW